MSENKKNKILLVDDDEFLLDMYALKFKVEGYDLNVAYSGEDAFLKLKEGYVPDAILLDVIMPKMNGFEFLEKIKKEKLLSKNTLVVVLSNLGQKEDIEKSKKLGADDYIIKANLTPSEVVSKIKRLLAEKNE